MNFLDYYEAELTKKTFRIKAAGRLGDDELDVIERVLSKYRPDSISTPKKMIFQTFPLGFTGVKNVEVWYVDAVLTVPAHAPILEYDLKQAFGLVTSSPLLKVEVEGENPIEHQEETLSQEHDALLLDNEYSEAEDINPNDLVGEEYKSKLLDYIQDIENDRDYKKEIDAPHPITKWAKQPKAELSPNYNDLLDKQPTLMGKKSK